MNTHSQAAIRNPQFAIAARVVGLFLVAAALLVAIGFWWYKTTRPDYRLRRGQEALWRNDSAEAERLADRLQASGYPDHAHLLRGQAYLHTGRFNQANQEYNQIRLDNEPILAEASLAYGLSFLSLGKSVAAEKLFLHVLEMQPDNVDAHRGLAVIYYDRGAIDKALDELEKWSRLDDTDGRPHRFMGLIWKDITPGDPAVEHYQAALQRRLEPHLREKARLELADLFIKRMTFAEALACLDQGPFETDRAQTDATELRAAALYGLSRASEAAQILEPLIQGGSPSPRVLLLRAQIYVTADDYNAAVPLLEKALQVDHHDVACRYQLAVVYELLGRRREAAEQRRLLDETQKLYRTLGELTQEANRKPRDPAVRHRLAEVCEQLGKFELAQTWRRAAESCQPEE
jgi:tetratricopeptide (TPR) repeat protein